ncbi:hypothetical protein Mame01_50490 [Microbispora amethystogenes]|nr:hypothetical protein Mame01_50490 [Microbispora amethystogenes]
MVAGARFEKELVPPRLPGNMQDVGAASRAVRRLAERTPSSRERFVDLLRAGSAAWPAWRIFRSWLATAGFTGVAAVPAATGFRGFAASG